MKTNIEMICRYITKVNDEPNRHIHFTFLAKDTDHGVCLETI